MSIRGIVYTIDNILCITQIDTISEVVQGLTPTPIPLTKDWLVGTIQLRGNIVPVTDILKLSNPSITNRSLEQHKNNILIIQENEWQYGIKVNKLMGIRVIQAEEKEATHFPPEFEGLPELVKGMYEIDEGYLYNINLSKLIQNNAFMHPEL
ncbi:chemotaxis protein CheW [Wohlfahrtiimonas larvae]|uniref:CheW-like domain-containing protein n=1 Tax=Wohlfahrtiimonas larvae TaxID=1157986 RepID=A0ABP9MDB1_9GAMM|nr:chemotaxis protein CheW [Wohlfahrtiimonas larvae]